MTNGHLVKKISLFSAECIELLRNAIDVADSQQNSDDEVIARSAAAGVIRPKGKSRYEDSSESSDDTGGGSERDDSSQGTSSDSEDSVNDDRPVANLTEATGETKYHGNSSAAEIQRESPVIMNAAGEKKKVNERDVQRHTEKLHCSAFPLSADHDGCELQLPTSLLAKEVRQSESPSLIGRSFLNLATETGPDGKPIVVFFLRSGRFAGAVFERDKCLVHTSSHRYTVRKGQGKAQSAQDSQRRPKSMGAQLRRAGEQNLKEDVANTIREWSPFIQRAALVLISCPKTMRSSLFGEGSRGQEVLVKDDPRIRRVPLDLGNPSFEKVCTIHSVMTMVSVRQTRRQESSHEIPTNIDLNDYVRESPKKGIEELVMEKKDNDQDRYPFIPPLNNLHVAAMEGDVEALVEGLASSPDLVNATAGELCMTPLHFAAEASEKGGNADGAECVYILLTVGKADPCITDVRNRPPYYLAESDKVREAFRRARADLGEEFCDWTASKVGPALTEKDIQLRKEKEAEKKRRKRARQKEKKVKERQHAQELERQKALEEEQRREEVEAKRIRDGLQPKANPAATNVCDYCQKICKGKRRGQMFQRLDYVYCSTECVQKHKRELLASAALSRFGG